MGWIVIMKWNWFPASKTPAAAARRLEGLWTLPHCLTTPSARPSAFQPTLKSQQQDMEPRTLAAPECGVLYLPYLEPTVTGLSLTAQGLS